MTDDKLRENDDLYETQSQEGAPQEQQESGTASADLSSENQEEINETKLQELEKENLRLRADMENLRKRAHKDKMDFARYANENLLCEIIPVIDNFERATEVTVDDPECKKFLTGFTMIQNQLEQVLKNAGLEKIEALDQPFDPNLHEAVEMAADAEAGNEIVTAVLRTGYTFNDKLIRPALVKVAKN